MIVATAGHIDHGKTSLVRVLTGIDTDRLPEEKARGISIDLGFAHWKTPAGVTVGFVDVPGHQRFVRNMLAGVCGIDYVMLVVAADDGVMPQTIEHLHIVDLLSVARGVAVITKADRVSKERVDNVAADVRRLLRSSSLSSVDVFAISSTTGQGVADVRNHLANAADSGGGKRAEGRNFRYAIDRAFSVPGSGTIVTGTVFSGAAVIGDYMTLSPAGLKARIRGIQRNGVVASEAATGERCALNLSGVSLDQVSRGQWVVSVHAPTQRILVRLRVLEEETRSLQHWTAVHLHLGTSHVVARVAMARAKSIDPGTSEMAHLITDKPISTVIGDRFIIRDQSATRTIGGGVVIDPFPPRSRSRHAQPVGRLEALESLDPAVALRALLACSPGGVPLSTFGSAFNLAETYLSALVANCDAVVIGRGDAIALPRAVVNTINRTLVDTIARCHVDTPQKRGVDVGALHNQVASMLSFEAFVALARMFAAQTKVQILGSTARLASHVTTNNSDDEWLWQQIKPVLENAGFQGIDLHGLALASKFSEVRLSEFLHRKALTNEVVRVAPKRFYTRSVLAQLSSVAQAISASAPDQQFTAGQFRDHCGINRVRAIAILECLDRLGITQRIGDARKMRSDFVPILGPAPVYSVAKKGGMVPTASLPKSPSDATQQPSFGSSKDERVHVRR